jgi:uridylate kinase
MDNRVPLYVFNLDDERNIGRIVSGERIGTLISSPPPEPRRTPGTIPVEVTP